MTEDATNVTSNSGEALPLFPFDVPPTITLPNGTTHHFRMWDEATEKKREDLLKTIVVTSPHTINGENPRDVKTDFTRSLVAYYGMMIDKVGGVSDAPTEVVVGDNTINAQAFLEDGKTRAFELIGVPVRKAAASRLYGGKVEVEHIGDEDEDEIGDVDFDPFAEVEIDKELRKAERHKEVYRLTMERDVIVRQELGIEVVAGRATQPTHVVRYRFREPNGQDFSKWELKGFRGYAVSLNKGGERAERYYNLTTVKELFNSLIESIDGASISGKSIDLPSDRNDPTRVALLAQVPLPIKKITVATLFSEMSNLGNS